jgi:hypothetical protein
VPIWLILITIVLQVLVFLLAPKPKKPKPPDKEDLENPTADAGKPVPWLTGTKLLKGLDVFWFGDKNAYRHNIDA